MGNSETGVMPVTLSSPSTSTQWNEDCGGTSSIDAAEPVALTWSMMVFIGASLSTSA